MQSSGWWADCARLVRLRDGAPWHRSGRSDEPILFAIAGRHPQCRQRRGRTIVAASVSGDNAASAPRDARSHGIRMGEHGSAARSRRSDRVTATPVAALAATLDRDDPAAEGRRRAAAAVALAVLPAALPAIGDRSRRPCEARRLPAAGAAAAPDVGRRALHVPRTAARRRARSSANRDIVDVTSKEGRSGPLVFVVVRHAIAVRAALRSSKSTTSSIATTPRRRRASRRRRVPAPADAAWSREIHPDPRAVVPLFGADLQRPSHPLRSPLCDRGRRLSRPDRARAADRDAAGRPAAPRRFRMRRSARLRFAR